MDAFCGGVQPNGKPSTWKGRDPRYDNCMETIQGVPLWEGPSASPLMAYTPPRFSFQLPRMGCLLGSVNLASWNLSNSWCHVDLLHGALCLQLVMFREYENTARGVQVVAAMGMRSSGADQISSGAKITPSDDQGMHYFTENFTQGSGKSRISCGKLERDHSIYFWAGGVCTYQPAYHTLQCQPPQLT